MTRTNNLSNTQFGYQIVLFIHILDYIGWLKVAIGIFSLGKTCGEVLLGKRCQWQPLANHISV